MPFRGGSGKSKDAHQEHPVRLLRFCRPKREDADLVQSVLQEAFLVGKPIYLSKSLSRARSKRLGKIGCLGTPARFRPRALERTPAHWPRPLSQCCAFPNLLTLTCLIFESCPKASRLDQCSFHEIDRALNEIRALASSANLLQMVYARQAELQVT